MKTLTEIFLLFLLLNLSTPAETQINNTFRSVQIESSQIVLPVKTYTVLDGLVSNRVRALHQDKYGFLWIGTTEGLSIYDGKYFTNYNRFDGSSNVSVLSIYERDDGSVWISTQEGDIIRFLNNKQTKYRLNRDKENMGFSFYEDNKGNFWCGTRYGLYLFTRNGFEEVMKNREFESVKNIYRYNDSLLTIVSDFDCYLVNTEDFTAAKISLNLDKSSEYIMDSIIDNEGDIWIGISEGSLIHLADNKVNVRYKLGRKYMDPCLCDKEGNIWASDIVGLYKFKKSDDIRSAVILKPENGLPNEGFFAMLNDNEGNIWLANYSEGLSKIMNQHFFHFPISNSIQAQTDKNYHIWVSTRTQILEYWVDKSKRWHRKNHKLLERSRDHDITFMKISDDELIRITGGIQIDIYAIRKGSSGSDLSFRSRYKINDNIALSIASDTDNTYWIAQRKKIISFRDTAPPRTDTVYLTEGSPQNIYINREGELWFGTFDTGLFRINVSPFADNKRKIEELKEFNSVHPQVIYQTNRGSMLIGSSGQGLFKLKQNEFNNISEGLPGSTIWDIAEGEDGLIWLATSNGLCYIENENSDKVFINDVTFGRWIYKCGELPEGIVWGIDMKGLFIYEYRKDLGQKMTPSVYITRISVNGKPIELKNNMELFPNQNNCDIEFIAPAFSGEHSIKYQYKLKKTDNEWSIPSGINNIKLASLESGTYNFQVRAVKYNGIVSSSTAVWSFTILSPFWQRWWFILLFILFTSSVIYLIMFLRIRRIKQIEGLRTQIASDLHDEIASNLSSITMFSKIIEERPSELPVFIKRISNLSIESVNSIRDIIWAINPQTETINGLLLRLYEMSLPGCRAKNIMLHFTPPLDHSLPEKNLTSEQRKNIWMMLKEAVNNSMKYSEAGTLHVDSLYANGKLTIRIKDDGKGFDSKKPNKGNGLETMKTRARELHGDLTINSAPGKGTEIILVIKI
jgi:ligand-binding sensor domain-containing protein